MKESYDRDILEEMYNLFDSENEKAFIAGYKYRSEMNNQAFDFASELHARSHYIKYKQKIQSEKK